MKKKRYKPDKSHSNSKRPNTSLIETLRIRRYAPISPTVAIAALYTVIMLYFALKFHTIGGFGVETDFYAYYIVGARALLSGDFIPDMYGYKGPVYFVLLASFKLMFGEYFRAGLIMNVLSAGGVIWLMTEMLRHVFGTRAAVLSTLFTISGFAFLHYSYSVGTDMVMVLFSLLTVYVLCTRSHSVKIVVTAGFCAAIAYLTRYESGFLLPGGILAILLMDWRAGKKKAALLYASLYTVSATAFTLPWYVYRWRYYANHPEILESMQNIQDTMPFNPFTNDDINILPHLFDYIRNDFQVLIRMPYSACIMIGGVVLIGMMVVRSVKFTRLQWAFFIFPVLHFLVLSMIPYVDRYALFRLPFYASLLGIPLVVLIDAVCRKLNNPRMGFIFYSLLLCLFLAKFYPGIREIRSHHEEKPDPVWVFELADVIRNYNISEDYGIISQRPHIGYYSDLRFIHFSQDIKTLPELFVFARKHRARFLWMTRFAAMVHPEFKYLIDNPNKYPRFEAVFANNKNTLYLIDID